MDFQIIINDIFSVLTTDDTLTPIDKKKVLSIINDFENGKWHSDRFQKFVWNNIKETALSYKERQALISEGEDSVLTESAKNLRLSESEDDISRGSEIAEIVLYGIMKHHYRALPVVPKIFYKQNAQDNAKGADSVHIVVENDSEFSLWFGESKFYNGIENARLDKIIESVEESLSLKKLKKENAIITSVSDINDFTEISVDLRKRITAALAQKESIDTIKPILNIPILLLHECAITKAETHLTPEYLDAVKEFHRERATAYFKKQIIKCSHIDLYSEINFHIILFPVPEKKPIVEKFIAKATVYRD
ncbi:MAG TPA: DUF1837 domain-containing protein [Flavisolibacter sp.]|nr:DUF1837 domain-containing protein [Flavisolibacter sp.]